VIWALALVAATSTSTTPRFTYDCIYDGDVEGVLETSTTATTARDLRPPPIPKPEPAEEEDPLVPRELRYAKYAALIDGGWSAALTVGWLMSARAWDAPYPEGLTGLAVARILYGTTWSLLVTTGITILRLTSGESWEGLRFGELRNEWHLGFEIPGGVPRRREPELRDGPRWLL
jgi:hypothetical protein